MGKKYPCEWYGIWNWIWVYRACVMFRDDVWAHYRSEAGAYEWMGHVRLPRDRNGEFRAPLIGPHCWPIKKRSRVYLLFVVAGTKTCRTGVTNQRRKLRANTEMDGLRRRGFFVTAFARGHGNNRILLHIGFTVLSRKPSLNGICPQFDIKKYRCRSAKSIIDDARSLPRQRHYLPSSKSSWFLLPCVHL